MNKDEFMKIAAALRGLYPKAGILDNEMQISIWAKVAANIPAEIGEQFVIDWAMTSKFPPSLADFNSYAVERLVPPLKDAMQAWGEVLEAVRRYGYDKQDEALGSLDKLTASVVRDMGWYSICMSEIDTLPTLRAQFRNAYDARAKAKEKRRQETGIRDMIAVQRFVSIEGGGE